MPAFYYTKRARARLIREFNFETVPDRRAGIPRAFGLTEVRQLGLYVTHARARTNVSLAGYRVRRTLGASVEWTGPIGSSDMAVYWRSNFCWFRAVRGWRWGFLWRIWIGSRWIVKVSNKRLGINNYGNLIIWYCSNLVVAWWYMILNF